MPNNSKKTVLIAGATGYAGRHLVKEYNARHPDWTIQALVRIQPVENESSSIFPPGVDVVVAQPGTLVGVLNGVDVVISAIGITCQRDGLTYQEVDYQANMNLLQEAISSNAKQFGYIHVLHGDVLARDREVKSVLAKQDFVDKLQQEANKGTISPLVICPSGFFSDMQDFLDMAKSGRVYLFGEGQCRINPIHGEDLATAIVNAMDQDAKSDTLTNNNMTSAERGWSGYIYSHRVVTIGIGLYPSE